MKSLLIILLTLVFFTACSDPQQDRELIQESTEFTRTIVQPEWFSRVDAEPLNSWQDVQSLWRSEKRCCNDDRGVKKANRVFYKSCYRAIESKPADVDLTPYCLWLMDVALDYEDSIKLSRYLLANHAQYAQPTDYCANCSPGDLIARTTRDVALYESRRGNNPIEAAARLESLLDSRESDISAWVLGEIYVSLAEIYEAIPVDDDAVALLEARIERLEANWPEDLQPWRLEDVRSAMRILQSVR